MYLKVIIYQKIQSNIKTKKNGIGQKIGTGACWRCIYMMRAYILSMSSMTTMEASIYELDPQEHDKDSQ